jgi:hypothetical protein
VPGISRRAAWPTLTLTLVALAAVVGVLLVTGTKPHPAARFSLSASPAMISLTGGTGADVQVVITGRGGFHGSVTLSTSTLPGGITVSFARPVLSLAAGEASTATTARFSALRTAAGGAQAVEITGASGGTSASAVVQLQVRPDQLTDLPPPPLPTTGSGALAFTVTGMPHGTLSPGSALPIELVLTNPNPAALEVGQLSVSITGTSNPACRTGNFAVRQYRGGYPLRVAAGARATLAALGVAVARWPQLIMLNLPTNQDACKGVRVSLGYAGTGSGV